jgi:hypothetical protein
LPFRSALAPPDIASKHLKSNPDCRTAASNRKTGKICKNTKCLQSRLAWLVVEKYCFAADSATNLPQISGFVGDFMGVNCRARGTRFDHN